MFSGQRSLDRDLLVHGSAMSPDPGHFAREFATDPPNPWDNAMAFTLQALLRASRRELDEQKRWNMVREAQTLFAEELEAMTLEHRKGPGAHGIDGFKG